MLREHLIMARESISHFHFTGCICSSSRWAAERLTAPIRNTSSKKLNIVEIGAGTGPVTMPIVSQMKEGDSLTICEINPNLMAELKRRIESHPDYAKHKENISFFTGPVQELPEDQEKFNVIVCALPFLNFDLRTVDEIFTKLLRISTDDAPMTYYEYIGLKKLGKAISPKDRKKRLNEIEEYFKSEYRPRQKKHERVWLNVLPINIYTLEMAA